MPNIEISGTKGLVQVSGAGGHLKSVGSAPTIVATTTGDGDCTISGTDVIGEITFTGTWDDNDTAAVTFASEFGTAPKVMVSAAARVSGTGVSLIEIDTIAVSTTGFTLTASGTCAGSLTYLVIETAAS